MSASTAAIVDTFIKRVSDGEIAFDAEKASSTTYSFGEDGKRISRNFADCLARALADYTFYRDLAQPELPVKVNVAFLWINRAYLLNIVKEGPTLLAKLEEARAENEVLRKELDSTSKRLAVLQAERNQLGKVGQLGDVEE